MKVPYHTDKCREGFGCAPHCPVVILVQQYEHEKEYVSSLERRCFRLEKRLAADE